ncbi:MAG: NTP transferase domain-containing protein [Sphingomonadales bacterium]|nr:NTP transferase domain-containing protein [Sphingomonadales bacterium]
MALAALVLAAGRGERFGGCKLDALFLGEPLLAHALRAACAAPVDRVLLVTRAGQAMPANDPRLGILTVESPALSVSLKAGLAALDGADGTFVFLGDMPLVPHGIAASLAAALGDNIAALPTWQGQPGHPVLLSRRGFALAAGLDGDRGLGTVLRGRSDVLRMPCEDEGVVIDVDTPAALARLSP